MPALDPNDLRTASVPARLAAETTADGDDTGLLAHFDAFCEACAFAQDTIERCIPPEDQ